MIHEDDEKELYESMIAEEKEREQLWIKAKQELTGLIEPKYFDFIESHEHYVSEGIVEIEETEERNSGYSNYKHCRVKGESDGYLYMHCTNDVETFDGDSEYEGQPVEYWVWQTSGYMGDDFSGTLLLPMLDGRYWKVGYSC